MFKLWACLRTDRKWNSNLTFLRSKISARPLVGPPRSDFGRRVCASKLKLKNVSKMCRIGGRFGGLKAGCPTVVSPWSLHGLSMVSPWRKHRLRSDEDPYIYTRCSESEGLSLRSRSWKHQIKDRIEDGGYPARSTAEGVGGYLMWHPSHDIPRPYSGHWTGPRTHFGNVIICGMRAGEV